MGSVLTNLPLTVLFRSAQVRASGQHLSPGKQRQLFTGEAVQREASSKSVNSESHPSFNMTWALLELGAKRLRGGRGKKYCDIAERWTAKTRCKLRK
jgi:hypothetical protein